MNPFGNIRKTLCLLLAAFAMWGLAHISTSLAKDADDFRFEFNPDVKLAELNPAQITFYKIENLSGKRNEGDLFNDEIARYLKERGVPASAPRDLRTEPGDEPFALNLSGTKKTALQPYAASPTDLVLSGKLTRLAVEENVAVPESIIFRKRKTSRRWTMAVQMFVYSISRDAIVYRVDLAREADLRGRNKNHPERAFRQAVEEALNPFFKSLAAASATNTQQIPASATTTQKAPASR